MKYKELLRELSTLSAEQLELEILVLIRDKDKFVSLKSGLFYVTEFDEYCQSVDSIFQILEGSVDKYYEKVERAQSKQPTAEWLLWNIQKESY